MHVLPIISALRHNKIGAMLVGLQIALTLAIVCNSVFVMQYHLGQLRSPSGLDEANTFTFSNEWATEPSDLEARIKADLAALRSLPGVVDAEATDNFPLSGFSGHYGTAGLMVRPDQRQATRYATLYFVDDHGLAAYNLNLTAGRWFIPAEVGKVHPADLEIPPVTVITQHLANELFPSRHALGQVVYFDSGHPIRIVGILERARGAYVGYQDEDSIFLPLQFLNNGLNYVVRTRPGTQTQVMKAAQDRLYALTRERVVQNMRPFSQTRRQATADARTNSVMLAVVCAVLLTVTACGIIGMTLYWVGQRRRYIGMRRALGARRGDILRYFQTENLLIASAGCVVGIALGLAGNGWLLTRVYGLAPMRPAYICVGALLVLGLSQAAVLWPALRAASVPPAIATRGL